MKIQSPIRVALILCGLLLAAACSANNDNPAGTASTTATASSATRGNATKPDVPTPATSTPFIEGTTYVRIHQPAGQAAPTGPVELVEAFSYGCPHCAHFAPYMDELRTQLPGNVTVRYMPVVFSEAWEPYAQAFYAARQLGVLEQTHDAVFKALLQHFPLNSLSDLANFYERHGVDRDKFLAAATSKATHSQMMSDRRAEIGWGVDATPTLVVGRRASDAKDAPFVALIRSNRIKDYEQLQQLGLWMVQQVGDH